MTEALYPEETVPCHGLKTTDAVPFWLTTRLPPELTTVSSRTPPPETKTVPPEHTTVSSANPPLNADSVPDTTVCSAVAPLERISRVLEQTRVSLAFTLKHREALVMFHESLLTGTTVPPTMTMPFAVSNSTASASVMKLNCAPAARVQFSAKAPFETRRIPPRETKTSSAEPPEPRFRIAPWLTVMFPADWFQLRFP